MVVLPLDSQFEQQLSAQLTSLYGEAAQAWLERFLETIDRGRRRIAATGRAPTAERNWSPRDVMLITYGDQLHHEGKPPLARLGEFLAANQVDQRINRLHLLPFFPSSSDDGFSVIDYREVNPQLGSWADIDRLAEIFQLTFDLVLNHVSSRSEWFQGFLSGDRRWAEYFIEPPEDADLSQVTRPRCSPLLTPFATSTGQRRLWTTFSADQIDLNFANPAVLLEFVDILLGYVEHGATCIRLDAIAYLWKELGTACIHHPQTHLVVKLLRHVARQVAPQLTLLTETNVPHQENISYFGDGDEADMVYQFSLPPLLLDAVIHEDARPLMQWLAELEPAPAGATFLNFTASHDGIGVRPLEGLIDAHRMIDLVAQVKRRGGLISTRQLPGGGEAPYELNISYVDAVRDPDNDDIEDHARRFLVTQAVMLSLQGVPGIYFHSLFGSRNDIAGVAASGIARRINRQRFDSQELQRRIDGGDRLTQRVWEGYRNLLRVRVGQPAFSPGAAQQALPAGNDGLVAFARRDERSRQRLVVVANVTARPQTGSLPRGEEGELTGRDLLTGRVHELAEIRVPPHTACWLEVAGAEQTS